RRADDVAALAVVLRFFAIEAPRHIAAVLVRERDSGRAHERDAFVGRAEQHIELEVRALDGSCVELAELGESPSRIEEPRVEEVGTRAAGLELELAEAQHAEFEAEIDER